MTCTFKNLTEVELGLGPLLKVGLLAFALWLLDSLTKLSLEIRALVESFCHFLASLLFHFHIFLSCAVG